MGDTVLRSSSYHDSGTTSLVNQVLEWLAIEAKNIAKDMVQELCECLSNCESWTRVIQVLKEKGPQVAMALLKTLKDQIMKFLDENKEKIKHILKVASKSGARLAAEQGAKFVTKTATSVAVKQGTKAFIKATTNPVGIAADVAQAGCEVAGYKEVGKKVGMGGNMASGALIGAAVGGPAGAVLGAAGGFAIWGFGEIVGGTVDKLLG